MKRVEIASPATPTWSLKRAVLVYDGNDHVYATVHEVEGTDKALRLGAGRPATKEACADLARSLGAMAGLSGFTPPELLYLGARSLIWWRPPANARLFFDTRDPDDKKNDPIGRRNALLPQPGLVFALNASDWFVYALADTARPGPATKLFRAPYFNVWEDGRICTGNVHLPDALSPAALAAYERGFFDSNFTHPNVAKLVRGQSAYAFWREGMDGKWRSGFPVRALQPLKITLAALAKRLEKQVVSNRHVAGGRR